MISAFFRLSKSLLLLGLMFLALPTWADEPAALPTYRSIPAAPLLKTSAYVLMDHASGALLVAQEPDKRVEPASLTKMMTVYVIDKALKEQKISLDETVHISENAWKTEGSRMFLPVGKDIPVRELLHGIIIQSGNDASVAMAEHLAGSEIAFASLMNQEAQRLGMSHTHFVGASGLPDPEHYTTARDMALLARAIIRDFPESYGIYSQKWYTFNGIKQPNRNQLLWQDPTVDGLKTGHTDSAGFCLVASATRDNRRLISVVMGTPNEKMRAEESKKLLTYGFRFFETRKMYAQNTPLQEVRLWLGQDKNVPVGLKDDLYLSLPTAEYNRLHIQSEIPSHLTAPITSGQTLGTLKILSEDGQVIRESPLIALKEMPKGGMWRRMTDGAQLAWLKFKGTAS